MAYISPNLKTKKALKEMVKNGAMVTVFSPRPFPCEQNGTICVEGPHYPEPHRWCAEVVVKNGIVQSVK